MTAQETYRAVLAELRKNNTSTMTPAEFNYHAWVGQVEYVKTRYWGYDQHQKAIDDLQKITVVTDGVAGNPAPLANVGNNVQGEEAFALPKDGATPYMFLLNAQFRITYVNDPCNTGESGWVAGYARPYNENSQNVYDQSNETDRVHYRLSNDLVRPLPGTYNGYVSGARISYLRYPVRMLLDETTGESVTDPELDDRVMMEVVKWISHSFLETIESYRLKTMEMVQGKTFVHQKNN